MVDYRDIENSVKALGLCLRGGFVDEDKTYILVGNTGSDIWKEFGPAYDDWVEPNPLDEWTKRHIDPIAADFGAEALYPFIGPPFMPFQRWAMKADAVFPSPIGPLIHPEYGLWHAYRAALVFEEPVSGLPVREEIASPCIACELKPCLVSCPVDAFVEGTFKFQKCLDHLNKKLEGSCMHNGCLARRACPIGAEYRYHREHARFHMDKFLGIDFG
ncbi:ferredoxin [Terasakiella sp.]|uniref:ferredoxin n=1 Tax=Terasakiella sp. TaxID=2034861 RepID=UPI003AA998AB